jgi:hypothetical protein
MPGCERCLTRGCADAAIFPDIVARAGGLAPRLLAQSLPPRLAVERWAAHLNAKIFPQDPQAESSTSWWHLCSTNPRW